MPFNSRVAVLAAIAGLSWGTSLPARGQDLSPRIDHKPTTAANKGQAVEIRARIMSVSGKAIYEPTVFVRVAGITGFTKVSMHLVAGMKDLFVADVPASLAS